jgi:hypothetical protein
MTFDFDDDVSFADLDKQNRAKKAEEWANNLKGDNKVTLQPIVEAAPRPTAVFNSGGGSSTGNNSAVSAVANTGVDTSAMPQEQIDTTSQLVDEAGKPAPIDIVAAPAQKKQESAKKSEKSKPKPKRNGPKDSNCEYVRPVPIDVMQAMRMVFPGCKLSNSDLISAFVYVQTGGNIEISEAAKRAVDAYNGKKAELDVGVEIGRLRKQISVLTTKVNAAELGVSFIVSDRLFSVERAPTIKKQGYRDSNTLDVLENLRADGKNQAKLDAERLGRQIHEAKGKTDYGQRKEES